MKLTEFKKDLKWSEQKDRELESYWRQISYEGRFVFASSELLQKSLGIDIILQGKENLTDIKIDTKHIRGKYDSFFLEEESCPAKQVPGWILKETGHPDYIFYAFWLDNNMEAYLIPFQPLRKWFTRNKEKYRLFQNKNTLNKTTGRLVSIRDLISAIPTTKKVKGGDFK